MGVLLISQNATSRGLNTKGWSGRLGLSEEDKLDIFGNTAVKAYRLDEIWCSPIDSKL